MDKLVNMLMPQELWKKVVDEAKDRGLNASAFIRMLIIDYFNSKEG